MYLFTASIVISNYTVIIKQGRTKNRKKEERKKLCDDRAESKKTAVLL